MGLLPSAELDALVRRRLSVSQQPDPFWIFAIRNVRWLAWNNTADERPLRALDQTAIVLKAMHEGVVMNAIG
jgi:hypothetical protein